MSKKELAVKTNRRVLRPDEPPIGIHHASFNRLGNEITMDIGFHDMAKLVREVQEFQSSGDSSSARTVAFEVEVTIFAQYAMGPETFMRLRQNVEEIYSAMVKSGDIVVDSELGEKAK